MSKVAVSTSQGGLEDQVSSVFGRCQTFTIVNVRGNEIAETEIIQNQYANASGGAGIQAAGMITNKGAEVAISGNFGPNVASVLNQAGVEMVPASGMTVEEAVKRYLNNELQTVTQATSPAKAGMGTGGGMRGGQSQRPGQRSARQPGQQPASDIGSSSQQKQPQVSEKERIRNIEERIQKIGNLLKETREALEELKK